MRYLTALLLLTIAAPAQAERWADRAFSEAGSSAPHTRHYSAYRERRHHHERPVAIDRRPIVVESSPRVYGYTASGIHVRPPSIEDCRRPMSTVGDQALSVEGAKEEAIKAWTQQSRFQHGERLMDIINAQEVAFACVRSSVGSLAGSVFHRCEIVARPCLAPMVNK